MRVIRSEGMLEAPARYGSSIERLCQVIGRNNFCVLRHDVVDQLMRGQRDDALTDWNEFRDSWSRLELDGYMGDGGRYRRRRHATLSAGLGGGDLRVEPHQPHYQTRAYNPLNGDVARHFEPIESEILSGSTLSGLLVLGCNLFGRLSPYSLWHIEVHQFRIEADRTELAKPTPEGTHRDGVSYVMMVMVQRNNVADGETVIYDLEHRCLEKFILSDGLDMAIVNDERVLHGVSPIMLACSDRPGNRDVLVITFRHKP
jgi:hypothetical protein